MCRHVCHTKSMLVTTLAGCSKRMPICHGRGTPAAPSLDESLDLARVHGLASYLT